MPATNPDLRRTVTKRFQINHLFAARAGISVACAFVLAGAAESLAGNFGAGVSIGVAGWLLWMASRALRMSEKLRLKLRGMTAANVMTADYPVVGPGMPLSEFVERYAQFGVCYAAVADCERLLGLVGTDDISRIPASSWTETSLQAVMHKEADLDGVAADSNIATVLELMGRKRVNQLAVFEGDALVGIIGRDRLMKTLRALAA